MKIALKQFTLLFLLFFSLLSHSQYYKRTQIDSLERVLQKQGDLAEINTILELSEAYISFQLDTALLYAQISIKKSKKKRLSIRRLQRILL